MKRMRLGLAALAGAVLLGGCATGYYDYGYGYRYDRGYYGYERGYPVYGPGYGYGHAYDYAPGHWWYDHPAYIAPSVGFGITYIDRGHRHPHHWRGDRHGRGDREGRRDRGDRDRDPGTNPLRREPGVPEMPRGGYDYRRDHGQNSPG